MKRMAAGLMGAMLLAMTSVACGPGLTHHAKAPEPPPMDVLTALDLELANSLSTTTLTSFEVLPDSRLSTNVNVDNKEQPVSATSTWGTNEGAEAPHAKPSMVDDRPYD
jgi:hypothetical protein